MIAVDRSTPEPANPALIGYLLFVTSWLLHIPARFPALGAMRIDLILVAVLFFLMFTAKEKGQPVRSRTDTLLRILFLYVIVTLPFVEWPGTTLRVGLENLVKAMVFYYFTVAFVRTERDLKRFLFVFIACEVIRILEPLTLHFTTGYWGSKASMMGGAESLYRLSGGPFDTVNPNGFAFIICTVFPFLFYFSTVNWKTRLAFFVLAPACLVALALTGSRSGLIGFGIVCLAILGKAKNRAALAAVIVAGGIIGFSLLESDMQDRYLSTFGLGTKNEATANERTEANIQQFYVVLRRPLFGHGLGTSPEANYHYSETGPYGGRDIPAHNLYLEIGQELGIFGLIIFLAFIVEILKSFARSRRACRQDGANTFYTRVIDAMQVWVAMNVVFSFASYGLSNYDWYLIGGLSVVMLRLAQQKTANETGVAPGSTRPPRALPLTSRMKQTST